jgi:hypothetical protein
VLGRGQRRPWRRVGEVDTAVGFDYHVIGSVELEAAITLGDDRDAAIGLLAVDAATEVVTHNEPSLAVSGLPIRVLRAFFVNRNS